MLRLVQSQLLAARPSPLTEDLLGTEHHTVTRAPKTKPLCSSVAFCMPFMSGTPGMEAGLGCVPGWENGFLEWVGLKPMVSLMHLLLPGCVPLPVTHS